MIFQRSKVALFAMANCALIAALLAVPSTLALEPRRRTITELPRGPEGPAARGTTSAADRDIPDTAARIDRHTGERIRSPLELLDEARLLGDARLSLERLRQLAVSYPDARQLSGPIRTLEAELSTPAPAPLDDPRNQRLLGEALDVVALTDTIVSLYGDDGIARATEQFFQRDEWPAAMRTALAPPADAMADQERHAIAGGRTDLRRFVDVAQKFEDAGRGRARVRWLLRGLRRYPGAAQIGRHLTRVLIGDGQLPAAWAVSQHSLRFKPTDPDYWKRRATLAGWLGKPAAEANALEQILARAIDDDDSIRHRLLALYDFIGEPGRAVPHALVMAERAGETAETERAIHLALTSGMPDQAFELLDYLIQEQPDTVRWREMAVDLALQDLRLDRAIAELRSLHTLEADVVYEERLEHLYRMTNRVEDLADLLEARLQRLPYDKGTWVELLQLRTGLRQDARVQQLLVRLGGLDLAPEQFFERFRQFERAGVPGLGERALEMARTGDMPDTIVADVLDQLRPFLRRERFRTIAQELLDRHGYDGASRGFRLELVDALPTAPERAVAARELFYAFPEDQQLLRAWIDRAAWAGDSDAESEARGALLERAPQDDANRARLAELLEASERYDAALPHWRFLAEKDGLRSTATSRLITALYAVEDIDRAMAWTEARAAHPDAPVEEIAQVGEQLFGMARFDQAALFFQQVLVRDPAHPTARLRQGQILSWNGAPHRAVALLQQHLTANPGDARGEHLLAEALWATERLQRARHHFRRSIVGLRAITPQTDELQSMVAHALARVGRADEAVPIRERLVEASPDAIGLRLDLAELLLDLERTEEAAPHVERALADAPDDARALRIAAAFFSRTKAHGQACAVLTRRLELHGPDAGAFAQLGASHEKLADWPRALRAYQDWLRLQPDSLHAAAAAQRVGDLAADVGIASTGWRAVGDDRHAWFSVGTSLRTEDDHRAELRLSALHFEGRAAAIDDATRVATSDIGVLDVALDGPVDRVRRFGGGLSFLLDAPGDLPVSGWLEVTARHTPPQPSYSLRLYANELIDGPGAAIALAGRRHGAQLQAYDEFTAGWWAGADTKLEALQIDTPQQGTVHDGNAQLELSLGHTIRPSEQAIASGFTPTRVHSGPVSPVLLDSPDYDEPWLLQAWGSLQSAWLLERRLQHQMPISARYHYAIVAGRADRQLCEGLGTSLLAHVGHELREGTSIWGVDWGMTWRPRPAWELTLRASIGEALGRTDDSSLYGVQAQLVTRW